MHKAIGSRKDFSRPDEDSLLAEYKACVEAVSYTHLYIQGHVPGSINIPTSQINTVKYEKDTPLYLYCLSGGRSKMAMGFLEQKGFQNVKNMGAIGQYRGELEK